MRTLFALALMAGVAGAASTARADAALTWYASRPVSQQVDWTTARTSAPNDNFLRQTFVLGELAKRTYSDRPEVESLGFRRTLVIDRTADALPLLDGLDVSDFAADVQAMVFESAAKEVRVVSVRGTDEFGDWLADVDARGYTAGGITYHAGFYAHARSVYDSIRRSVAPSCGASASRPPIWLTGHSLGGAVAQILGLWLQLDGCLVGGIMTFGAPRPGRSGFAEAFLDTRLEVRSHRWVHAQDPVACLPVGSEWATPGSQHTISSAGLSLRSRRDVCDPGGLGELSSEGLFSLLRKLHEWANLPGDAAGWIHDELSNAGLCTDEFSWGRLGLGLLTGGVSELACQSLEDLADIHNAAEQVSYVVERWLLDRVTSRALSHALRSAYLIPVTDANVGHPDAPFCEPIWHDRMDRGAWPWSTTCR